MVLSQSAKVPLETLLYTGGPWLAQILGQRINRASQIRASEVMYWLFLKHRASEIFSTCYPRNGLHLKIRASEIRTSEICASQGPPVIKCYSVKLKWMPVKWQLFVCLVS